MRHTIPVLALLGLLVEELERGGGGVTPAPRSPSSPAAPSGAGQVAATRTPASASAVAGAIVRAYQKLRGRAPPAKSSWLWPLALSANETDSWRAMYNYNAGDVLAFGQGGAWFAHPLVRGAYNRFVDCADLDAGVMVMMRTLDGHGGLAAADAGDRVAWQKALDDYLGAKPPAHYPDLSARIAALASTAPAVDIV